MPTTIKGRFDKPVAEKIYSNSIKGNPAFKPWKGKDGCAWFGYDGNPNPGAMARNKAIEVEAEVDIPVDASRITKLQLENQFEAYLLETKQHFPSAEGKLWTWVGNQGEQAVSGFLIVEVGNTKLSQTSGKYLLVNNRGMGRVTMTLPQQTALVDQLDHGVLQKLTLKQQKQEELHGKIVKLDLQIPKEKIDKYDANEIEECLSKWIKLCKYPADPVQKITNTFNVTKFWAGAVHSVCCVIEFGNYIEAKRNARIFVNGSVPLTFTDKTVVRVAVKVSFGQGGAAYAYKNRGNVVNPPVLGAPAW
jgi:hypothetical protein